MNRALAAFKQHIRRMSAAYLVLLLSLIPTAVVYFRVKATVQSRDLTRFQRVVREEAAAIRQQIPHYVDGILGFRGLFAANHSVTRGQWQSYIASTEIQSRYPGLRTLGYLQRVNPGELKTFLAADPFGINSTNHLRPEGRRDFYFPTVFINHFEPQLKSGLGVDHFANAKRRAAMELARDSGDPEATANVELHMDAEAPTNKVGFVIYLPVYKNGAPLATIPQRRAALQGFIFATFDAGKLTHGIIDLGATPLVDCAIFDGPEISSQHLLYAEDPSFDIETDPKPVLAQTVTLPVLNRSWTLYFRALPSFAKESEEHLPLIALICWLTLSVLLFGVTYVEVNARSRSEDITAKLRASESALAAEKERLAVTLYSIGDGVITTDIAGGVLSINKVAEELTGWTQADAVGKPLGSFFTILNEQTHQPCFNQLEMVLGSGATCGSGQPALLIARDGRERIIADSAAPIRNREGGIIGAVVVFRDITARQKSEAELLKESKLESVGLLAGGIAHDFNNILQGILGNLSLARMNSSSAEKMLERLAGVEKSALRAKDLTQQLVMFARGGAPIRKRMQLANPIKEAATFALHGSEVRCEFNLPCEAWAAEVDEGQFRQVINNLILNAVQAMPDGGKIEVTSENAKLDAGFLPALVAGNYIKITVRDFGVGIQPEHLSRIFDPYFTTRRQARGLGLASAYSVIRKHEGQITVETQPGSGTAFHIYLPASARLDKMPTPEDIQRRFFGQGRILVMDDEPDILTLVSEILETMGYEVAVARDGAEALQIYMDAKDSSQPFAAVIMDLTVPEGMGGKEAIRRLIALDPQVKAIVSSGYSFDPVMANFREYGFSGVMPKPYVMEELGRVLEEVIRREPADTVADGVA
jgi:PAS domain S-box-containing protein